MWGKKKKTNTGNNEGGQPQGQFMVHTMQDDIDHPKISQPIEESVDQSSEESATIEQPLNKDTPSPFSQEGAPQQEDSPFFQRQASEGGKEQDKTTVSETVTPIPTAPMPATPTPEMAMEEVKAPQKAHNLDSPQQPLHKSMDVPQPRSAEHATHEVTEETAMSTPAPEGEIVFEDVSQKSDVDTVESWGEPHFAPQPEKQEQSQKQQPSSPQKKMASPFGDEEDEVISEKMQKPAKARKSAVSHGSPKILFIIIAVIALLIVAGGAFGWFWFNARSDIPVTNPIVDHPIVDDETVTDPIDEIPADDLPTYSHILPNYITLLNEPTTAESFAQSLQIIDTTIQAESVLQPVTFLVTNDNQATLSFRDFVTATDIRLSEAVLAALGDQFEVYAYFDPSSQETRFGFAVDVHDDTSLRLALASEEINLHTQLSALFLEDVVAPPEGTVFADSTYGSFSIRYVNFGNHGQSIDYAIANDRLILGTSKNTMRAFLDHLFGEAPVL